MVNGEIIVALANGESASVTTLISASDPSF